MSTGTPEEIQKLLDQDRKEQRILLAKSIAQRSSMAHAEIAHLLQLTADEILAAFGKELP